MKPLLKPAGNAHPDLLQHALGISAIASVPQIESLEPSITQLLAELSSLTCADLVALEERQIQGVASLRSYVLSRGDSNTGNAQIAFGGQDCFTINALLFWSFLPASIGFVVASIDRLWHLTTWRTLYAYDADDYSLQNCTMIVGMENWGLQRGQVDVINRFGTVEQIDTRANPGYLLNHDGLFWSVQWLNYWSKEAQSQMLAKPLSGLPEGVELRELGAGAVCVKLRDKPGLLDDVGYHQLQLECRQRLSFKPPFDQNARL